MRDPYAIWSQELVRHLINLTDVDDAKAGIAIARLRGLPQPIRRKTVWSWRNGRTSPTLPNFLALCDMTELDKSALTTALLAFLGTKEAALERAEARERAE